jgi:flagellar biosynthesis GTPase FlhF
MLYNYNNITPKGWVAVFVISAIAIFAAKKISDKIVLDINEKIEQDATRASKEAEALKAASDKEAADKLTAEEIFKAQIEEDRAAAIEAQEEAARQEQFAKEREEAERAAAIQQALADLMREEAADIARQEEAERAAAAEKALYDLMHPIRNIEISYSSVKSDAWNNSKKYFDVYIPKLYENDKFYMLQLTFYKQNGDVEKIWDFGNSYIKNNNFVVELSLTDYYHYGIVVSILENFGLPNERIVKTPKQNIQIIDDYIQVD